VRTAAVSAVSVSLLTPHHAHVLAILGSGVQARSHLQALQQVRSIDEIRVWSPNSEHLEAFVAEAGGITRAARSAEEAVRGADIVLAATNSVAPVLRNEWVQDGTHVIGIGACRPTIELDPALVARARLIVDSRAAARPATSFSPSVTVSSRPITLARSSAKSRSQIQCRLP
jgi:ornithine cyclodeaminase/alanine dehydrogenase-like protein (mu-crystallin family)